MNKQLLLFACFLFFFLGCNHTANAQQYHWLEQIGATEGLFIKDIVTKDGEVYLTGGYEGIATFGSQTITSTPSTSGAVVKTDIFVAKYDTLGNLIWLRSFGGSVQEMGSAILVDANNDIYLHGAALGIIQFDQFTLNQFSSTNGNQFMVKLNSIGNTVWAKSLYAGNHYLASPIINRFYFDDLSSELSFLSNGDVYLSTTYARELRYDNDTISVPNCNSGCFFSRGALLTINPNNGSLVRSKSFGVNPTNSFAGGNVYITGTAVLPLDQKIVTAFYKNNFRFDTTTLPPSIRFKMIVMKLDASDSLLWIKTTEENHSFRSTSDQVIPRAMRTDVHANAYIVGSYRGYFEYDGLIGAISGNQFNQGVHTGFVLKIDAQGNGEYIQSFPMDSISSFDIHHISDVTINPNGEVFGVGTFVNTIEANGVIYNSNGSEDTFVFKLDSLGNTDWVNIIGGGASDYGDRIQLTASDASIIACGRYTGLSSFGTRVVNSVSGTMDGFMVKIGECDAFQADISALGDTTFCSPGSVRLITSNGVGYQYQWLKDGSVLPGETFPNYLVVNSGDYTVVVNANGCIDTTRAIQVREGTIPPHVSWSLAQDSLCENDAPVLLSNGTPIGGTYSGNGVLGNQFFPDLANLGNNQLTYKVDSIGCEDSALVTIHVAAAPVPNIAGQTQVCANTSGVSYSTITVGPNFNWQVNGGSIVIGQGTNNIIVNWGATGTGSVALTETNAEGCDTSVSQTVNIVDQQFNGTIVGVDTACVFSTNTYSVSTPSLFYNWTVAGGSIQTGQGTASIAVQWNTVAQGTLSVRLFNSCGNDSTFYDTVQVSELPVSSITGPSVICENESNVIYTAGTITSTNYQWGVSGGSVIFGQGTPNVLISPTISGTTTIQLIETNAFGCSDSTLTNLTVLPTYQEVQQTSICNGAVFNFLGRNLTQSGSYIDTVSASNGCDSIITLNLTVLPLDTTQLSVTICTNESYAFNGQMLNTTGIYIDTLQAANGCDSLLILNLTVTPTNSFSFTTTICQGDSVIFGNQQLTSAGNYSDTLASANGCDSIVTIILTVLPNSDNTISSIICFEESYNFKGQLLTNSGTYVDTLNSANACDSVVTLNLTVLPQINTNLTASICQGDSFAFGNSFLTASGNYSDTLIAVNNCDSMVRLSLSVLPNTFTLLNESICDDEFYAFGGALLDTNGTFYDTLTAVNGCDSLVQLNLTVLFSSSSSVNVTVCAGESYDFNGQLITMAGNYTDTIIAASGCDSTINLNLAVLPSVSTSISRTICGTGSGSTYDFNGRILNSQGTYSDTLAAANGCDSVVVLSLSSLSTASTNFSATICQGETYSFAGQPLTLAGTYHDTLIGVNGCDSISVLILTVQSSLNDSVLVQGDSLIAIELGANYQWLQCDTTNGSFTILSAETLRVFIPSDSNYYAVEISNASCLDTSSCYQKEITTTISEYYIGNKVQLYPNPTRNSVTLEANGVRGGKIRLEIRTINGELLSAKVVEVNNNRFIHQEDFSNCGKGVYLIRLISDKQSITKRVVVN